MLRRSNRLRDAALVVPLGGVVLFLPPYVLIFDQAGVFYGIPFLHIALFACWFIGIVLTAVMARLLIRARQTPPVLDEATAPSSLDQMDDQPDGPTPLDSRTV